MAFRRTYLCWSVGCSFCMLGRRLSGYICNGIWLHSRYHLSSGYDHNSEVSINNQRKLRFCYLRAVLAVKTQERNNKVALIVSLNFAGYHLLTTTHACFFSTEFGRISAFSSKEKRQTYTKLKVYFATDPNSLTLEIVDLDLVEIKETNLKTSTEAR